MAKKDRREEHKERRRDEAKARQERRSGDAGWKGDKRSPEGRQAQDAARENRGYTRSEDPDLKSPPGGTQREVWVKDNDDNG